MKLMVFLSLLILISEVDLVDLINNTLSLKERILASSVMSLQTMLPSPGRSKSLLPIEREDVEEENSPLRKSAINLDSFTCRILTEGDRPSAGQDQFSRRLDNKLFLRLDMS